MPEWLYEAGIGENRAALVENGMIIEIAIEPDRRGLAAGSVVDARLVDVLLPARRGIARLDDGTEVLVEPLITGLCMGGMVRIDVTREALPERGVVKRAKGRPAPEAALRPGPDLRARIDDSDHPVVVLNPRESDRLEDAGWTEWLDVARTGVVAFAGGTLRIEPTAAMTVIDVDGHLAPADLALHAAPAAARAIRKLGIAGSIAIDFPTLAGKAERMAVGTAFDAHLPRPFERTAINGFGLLHVIRPRVRASLIEHVRADPAGHAARALLRVAERSGLIGATALVAAPAVVAVLSDRPDWIDRLARHLGGAVTLRSDPTVAILSWYVQNA